MKTVYFLSHYHIVEYDQNNEEVGDTKHLGFFSSKELCLDAIEFYKTLEGFRDYPDGFVIDRKRVDVNDFNNVSSHYTDKVYQLTHEWYDGEYDYISELGCYSTYEKAKIAQSLYENEEEFEEHKEGFCIDECRINQRDWIEGFFTWYSADTVDEEI